MIKEVLVSMKGLQFDGITEGDPIEVITTANYYKKNGKHYVCYDEVLEGFEGKTKNLLKFSENSLAIIKKGITNVNMVFERNKKNVTCYDTPFGNLMIGIMGKNMYVTETEEDIDIKVNYALDINYEHLADCEIFVNIKSKEAKNFSLM